MISHEAITLLHAPRTRTVRFNPRLVISHEAISSIPPVSDVPARFNPRLVISHEAMREAAEGEEGDKVSIRAS